MKSSFCIITVLIAQFFLGTLLAQESKIIQIRQAGGSTQDQERFPDANILFKSDEKRVILYHDGALIESHQAYFYKKKNYLSLVGYNIA